MMEIDVFRAAVSELGCDLPNAPAVDLHRGEGRDNRWRGVDLISSTSVTASLVAVCRPSRWVQQQTTLRETLSHPVRRMVAQTQSTGCLGDQEMEHEEKQPAELDSGIWTLWLKCW
jgi:hypothetical protein